MQPGNIDNTRYSNRVLDALRLYAEQETQLLIANPRGHRTDRTAMQLKYQHYTNLNKSLRKGADREERRSLQYVRKERGKLRAALSPTIARKILYSGIVDTVRNFMAGKHTLYKWHYQTLQNDRQDTIRTHNLVSLQDSLKKTGFNMSMEGPLQKMIDLNLPEFHLQYNDPLHCKNTDFTLHFKKIPGADIYYLEKFDASSRLTLQSVLTNDNTTVRQSFSLLDKMKVTAVEAANLVNGRSVCKEVDGKETWLSLDLTRKDKQQNYAYKAQTFDLEKVLGKWPIKQWENLGQRNTLLDTLKMGNGREVTMIIKGQSIKYTIEDAPSLKTIHIFDNNNRLQDAGAITGDSRNMAKQKLTRMAAGQEEGIIDMSKPKKGQSI